MSSSTKKVCLPEVPFHGDSAHAGVVRHVFSNRWRQYRAHVDARHVSGLWHRRPSDLAAKTEYFLRNFIDGAEWFTSYLSGRLQHVQHSGRSSATTILSYGVPQGSVLGPILFILYAAYVTKNIQKFGLPHHLFADDSQIYGFCQPSAVDKARLRDALTACISEIASLMKSNRLQFNSFKTKLIWFSSSRQLNQLDSGPFLVCSDLVQPTDEARDLGLQLDNSLTLVPHITKVVRTCFGVLRQLRSVIRTLPRDVSRRLVQSFVLLHVDHCNAIFVGLPQREIARLQAVVNAAARLISGVGKYDHITPVLHDVLHILRINQRIKFKLCPLVFKCLHNLAPQYLRDHINLIANFSSRKRLRSYKTPIVSSTHAFLYRRTALSESLVPQPGTLFFPLFKRQTLSKL